MRVSHRLQDLQQRGCSSLSEVIFSDLAQVWDTTRASLCPWPWSPLGTWDERRLPFCLIYMSLNRQIGECARQRSCRVWGKSSAVLFAAAMSECTVSITRALGVSCECLVVNVRSTIVERCRPYLHSFRLYLSLILPWLDVVF